MIWMKRLNGHSPRGARFEDSETLLPCTCPTGKESPVIPENFSPYSRSRKSASNATSEINEADEIRRGQGGFEEEEFESIKAFKSQRSQQRCCLSRALCQLCKILAKLILLIPPVRWFMRQMVIRDPAKRADYASSTNSTTILIQLCQVLVN